MRTAACGTRRHLTVDTTRAAEPGMDTGKAKRLMPEMRTRHNMKAGRHTLTCDRPGRATPVCIRRGRWEHDHGARREQGVIHSIVGPVDQDRYPDPGPSPDGVGMFPLTLGVRHRKPGW